MKLFIVALSLTFVLSSFIEAHGRQYLIFTHPNLEELLPSVLNKWDDLKLYLESNAENICMQLSNAITVAVVTNGKCKTLNLQIIPQQNTEISVRQLTVKNKIQLVSTLSCWVKKYQATFFLAKPKDSTHFLLFGNEKMTSSLTLLAAVVYEYPVMNTTTPYEIEMVFEKQTANEFSKWLLPCSLCMRVYVELFKKNYPSVDLDSVNEHFYALKTNIIYNESKLRNSSSSSNTSLKLSLNCDLFKSINIIELTEIDKFIKYGHNLENEKLQLITVWSDTLSTVKNIDRKRYEDYHCENLGLKFRVYVNYLSTLETVL